MPKWLKNLLTFVGIVLILAVLIWYTENFSAKEKPVIYLYPEEATEVIVTLELDGTLTTTHPFQAFMWIDFASHLRDIWLPPSFYSTYFSSQPPHSTTVKPVRVKGGSSCSGMSMGLASGLKAMKTRRRQSGSGVICSLAESV